MILLQTTTLVENTPSWRLFLQDINQIAQILGTIMIVIYVVYTYKTFKQIKKQTDYQQDAYLRVETLILKDINIPNTGIWRVVGGALTSSESSLSTKYLKTDISNKMIGVLKPIFSFDDNLYDGNFYTVVFTNYGNAEVNRISVKLSITIFNSEQLINEKMLKDKEIYLSNIEINEIVGRNGGLLKIPLVSTAAFPIFSISLVGEYYDVRNKKYIINETALNGQNEHFHKLS